MSIKDMYRDIQSSCIPNRPELEANCPSTREWAHKLWCIHTTEYYAARKRENVAPNHVDKSHKIFSKRNWTHLCLGDTKLKKKGNEQVEE